MKPKKYFREEYGADHVPETIRLYDTQSIYQLMQEYAEKYHQEKMNKSAIKLNKSLGKCTEGNDYEIIAGKDGRFWINHKHVCSGEPLIQWIKSTLK